MQTTEEKLKLLDQNFARMDLHEDTKSRDIKEEIKMHQYWKDLLGNGE